VEPIEVLKAGNYVDKNSKPVAVTADDLAELAANYDPAVHESPIVVGHPQFDAPAYGWIKRFFVERGVLKAEPTQVDDSFAQMVRNGRFKKVSLAFFWPKTPGNPVPGKTYPKHLGFLGAAPPAVTGLKPAMLAAGEDQEVVIEFSLPLYTEKTVELEQREKALLERERALATAEHRLFVDTKLVDKVPPAQRDGLVEFMAGIDGAVELSAGDGGKTSRLEWFKGFLTGLPKVIEFSEIAPKGSGEQPGAVEFSAPPGAIVDQELLVIHVKALAYQKANPGTDYMTAVREVGGI
jgi:hypothetical protein